MPEYLDTAAAAKHCGFSLSTAKRLIAQGKFAPHARRVGDPEKGLKRWIAADLDAWIASSRGAAVQK